MLPSILLLLVPWILSGAGWRDEPRVIYTQRGDVNGAAVRTYASKCVGAKCTARLSLWVDGGRCDVSATASHSDFDKTIHIQFVMEQCEGKTRDGKPLAIDWGASTFIKTDATGRLSQTMSLHFGSFLNDLVARPFEPTLVQVDASFPGAVQQTKP